jgi:putative transcriptional regulator
MLEAAQAMRVSGLIGNATHEKITMRHLGDELGDAPAVVLSGEEIREMREKANLSQAVFAHFLKVTVGYVSQLERGTKRPTGPTLVLLDVIRRKGFGEIL